MGYKGKGSPQVEIRLSINSRNNYTRFAHIPTDSSMNSLKFEWIKVFNGKNPQKQLESTFICLKTGINISANLQLLLLTSDYYIALCI